MVQIVQHHVKYKEIHGVDEIILMTSLDHQRLHRKLRKSKKCNMSIEKLHKISVAAHQRTEHGKQKSAYYNKNIVKRIYFNESIESNIAILEEIVYNKHTGNVYVSSFFRGYHNTPLYFLQDGIK